MKKAIEAAKTALAELEKSKAAGPHVDCAKQDLKAVISNLQAALKLGAKEEVEDTEAKK